MLASAIFQRLLNDTELAGMLAIIDGMPAVFQTWAEPDTPFPYVVFRLSDIASDHWGRRVFTLYIDVWDYNEGGHPGTAKAISKRIVELFDRQGLTHPDFEVIRCNLGTRGMVPEDTSGIVHLAHQFTVIAWRKKFIEKLIEE